jgi:hypothetical protein
MKQCGMELKPNQVFIFGSNSTGFHGAGSAGLACRGESKNTWRQDEWFLKAMKSSVGSSDRIGKWAIYGVSRGFQEGSCGKSYAIETIKHPGKLRTTSLEEIEEQLKIMFLFILNNPQFEFLMTPIGTKLAGWSEEEMGRVFDKVCLNGIPQNLIIPKDLYKNVFWEQT